MPPERNQKLLLELQTPAAPAQSSNQQCSRGALPYGAGLTHPTHVQLIDGTLPHISLRSGAPLLAAGPAQAVACSSESPRDSHARTACRMILATSRENTCLQARSAMSRV